MSLVHCKSDILPSTYYHVHEAKDEDIRCEQPYPITRSFNDS